MKYFLITLYILASPLAFSQESFKEVHINTTFKGNNVYKHMAYSILEAVKVGRLPIYTPLDKRKQTNFETLLYQLRGWTANNLTPNENCNNSDIEEVATLFDKDYVLYYDNSNVMSEINHSPVFVQFVILKGTTDYPLDILGPIFFFEDIKKARIKLKGTNQFLHLMIQNNQYQGYEVIENGQHVPIRLDK